MEEKESHLSFVHFHFCILMCGCLFSKVNAQVAFAIEELMYCI